MASGEEPLDLIIEKIEKLAGFGLSKHDREKTQHELSHLAIENRSALISIVHNMGPDNYDPLLEVYEALSEFPQEWCGFMLDEIDRLLESLKRGGNRKSIFEQLSAVTFFSSCDETDKNKFLKKLLKLVSSDDPQTRWFAVDTLADFATCENSEAVSVWQKTLLQDNDWRVRHAAFLILEDEGAIPARYSKPILDKIRSKISNPYKF